MFVDHIKIHARAGDGGNGCVGFRREKFVPKGGPNGGDGGRGGDIILRVDENVDNLASFFYEPIVRGKKGENGMGKNLYGRAAKPTYLAVPPGTLVYRQETAGRAEEAPSPRSASYYDLAKEPDSEAPVSQIPPASTLVADLTRVGEEFLLCKGGEGGKGNVHFKSSKNRVPRECTPGGEGEEGVFFFELRKIADAGLVGFPNAGKSTLLGAISAAKPKVAAYPFTTLHPTVGVIEFPGYQRATVADIPGLIEGAHRNVGLGHEFLRHIVRCKLLIFVLDMAGTEGRNPLEDFGTLREELKLHDPLLAEKPWIVVANKMDLPDAAEHLRAFQRRHRKAETFPISAEQGEGLSPLRQRLAELL